VRLAAVFVSSVVANSSEAMTMSESKVFKYRKPQSGAAGVPLRDSGWESLACAVVEQAVYDYRFLNKHGLVAAGVPVDDANWPTYLQKSTGMVIKQRRDGYVNSAQVADLVWFLRSDYLDQMLYDLGLSVRSDHICDRLGITK
jgi:hypothetical protein